MGARIIHRTLAGEFGSAALLVKSLCRRGRENATVLPVVIEKERKEAR